MRFPDRLRVTYRIPPALEDALVPALILQPLVENALRHGVAPSAAAGRVEIQARADGETLHLTVTDDGVGPGGAPLHPGEMEPGPVDGAGVGLRNVEERLRVLYGTRAGVRLDAGREGGAAASIHLPLERRGPQGGDVGPGPAPGGPSHA